MKVFFIGAGPGDPELLTLKAARIIGQCSVCLYAGSLVPVEVVDCAPENARVVDTAPLTLNETHAEIMQAHAKGQDVARVHSGDPSLYGAIAEQIRLLRADGIEYEIIPSLQIIDGFEKRQKREFPKHGNECELKIDNPAAEITLESIEIIKKAFEMTSPVRLIVNGEEDLLVLPVCIHAPENSVVLYGQPNKGLVLVQITTEIRNKAQTLLDMMK